MREKVQEPPVVSALSVGTTDGGQQLRNIFRDHGWQISWARTCAEAHALLDSTPVQVVITERDLPGHTGWRDLLADLGTRPAPPALVVTSRLADESLWAEVLNMGGFDVLAQPLETEEVTRVIGAAFRYVDNERQRRRQSRGLLLSARQ